MAAFASQPCPRRMKHSAAGFLSGAFPSHVMSQAFPRRPFQQQDFFMGAFTSHAGSERAFQQQDFSMGAFTSRANMFVK